MNLVIPLEYKEFLAKHGPFEGFTIGGQLPSYVALWTLEELPGNNTDLQVQTLAPGYVAFAGDGGGEVLAFDASGSVFLLPMIGMESKYAKRIAGSFAELAARFETAA